MSLDERRELLGELLDRLRRLGRIEAEPIEVLVETDAGVTPSGIKRNWLLTRARGRFVAFVDDDDTVAAGYFRAILAAIATEPTPDCVTFDLERTGDDRPPVIHSFGVRNPDKRDAGREVDGKPVRLFQANHLCAWRAELARKVAFPPIGYADDVFWYRPLLASGLVRREVHVDEVLYQYHYASAATRNQSAAAIEATRRFCGSGVEAFRLGDDVHVARAPIDQIGGDAIVPTRNGLSRPVDWIRRAEATPICITRIKG